MARGWESKSVEEQIEAAIPSQPESGRKQLTPEQIETQRRKENLLLCRTQVLRSLATCQNPRYEAILRRTLADLDAKITEV